MAVSPPSTHRSVVSRLAALPERYQPVFGHPELSDAVSRHSQDRLKHLEHTYLTLERCLQRPLRVLDLGCAQGYFSLSLASLGATVLGIDFQQANIDLCHALAAEQPQLAVTFVCGTIENLLATLVPGDYDLVLGLSVFHHMVYQSGIPFVQKMLTLLAQNTLFGVYEMALASEPPAWAQAQPQDPVELMQGYVYVRQIARHGTHLSDIQRPLYLASNYYWLQDDEADVLPLFRSSPARSDS